MANQFFVLFWLVTLSLVSYADWVSPTSTLITGREQIAVGALNDSIFLLGGFGTDKRLSKYRIDTDTFVDMGTSALSVNIHGFGQFYTHKDGIVYMIEPSDPNLSTFNMMTQQFTSNWINLEVDVRDGGCLATANNQLFVVAGYSTDGSHLDTLQVLDLSTSLWMNNPNPPALNEVRSYAACIAYYDSLWVFSGYTKTNERVGIANIASNQWSYIDPLTVWIVGVRAVAWQQSIFLIGGAGMDGVVYAVHIVDVITGKVILSSDTLVYPVVTSGVIIKDNVIYAFGGSDEQYSTINRWMTYELFLSDPTVDISSTVDMSHSGSTTADEQIIKTTATSESTTSVTETDTIDTSVTETYALRTTKYKSTMSKATEVEQHSTMFAGSITTHSLTADDQIITTTNTAFILTQSQSMPRTNTESTHDRNSTKASLSTGIIIAIIVIVSILTVLCIFIVITLYRSMTVKHLKQFNDMHHSHHDDQQSGGLKEEMKSNISIQPSVGIQRVNNAHKNRDSDSERLYDVYVVSNHTKRKISDSEQLYTKNPISTDTMDIITTANASDSNTKMGEENRVEANDVVGDEEGAARLRNSEGGEPKCNACRLVREGKVDDYDGEFYCFVCWSQYEITDGSGNVTSK